MSDSLDNEINRLIKSSGNYKEARKAILYSLVAVWINHKDTKYATFCEFVNSKSRNLITFDHNVTYFTDAAYAAFCAAVVEYRAIDAQNSSSIVRYCATTAASATRDFTIDTASEQDSTIDTALNNLIAAYLGEEYLFL